MNIHIGWVQSRFHPCLYVSYIEPFYFILSCNKFRESLSRYWFCNDLYDYGWLMDSVHHLRFCDQLVKVVVSLAGLFYFIYVIFWRVFNLSQPWEKGVPYPETNLCKIFPCDKRMR